MRMLLKDFLGHLGGREEKKRNEKERKITSNYDNVALLRRLAYIDSLNGK